MRPSKAALQIVVALAAYAGVFACHSPTGPSGPALLLSANVVDPMTVNAVSKFNSCVGHPFPLQTSPNSGKNYFWPASSFNSTTNQLRVYAACDGTISQPQDDTNDTSPIATSRGQAFHLYCDNSSTGIRYQEITFVPGIVGLHVRAGDLIAYADLLGNGQSPAASWQFSSNFDIGVFDGDDSATVNYFSKLSAAALSAWAARGVTSAGQTINPGNPTCASFNSNIGQPDIFLFTPPL